MLICLLLRLRSQTRHQEEAGKAGYRPQAHANPDLSKGQKPNEYNPNGEWY